MKFWVFSVVMVATIALADGDRYPATVHPDEHPDRAPSETYFPGLPNSAPAPAPETSVYDSATAIWCFNDNTDLGDDCASDEATYDLTTVNTPTATGGALGYAFANDGTQDVRAAAPDSAALSAAGGSFTVCIWANANAVSDDDFFVGKDDWGDNREWHIRNASNKPSLYISRDCDNYDELASTTVDLVAGESSLICGRYDTSTNKAVMWMNGALGTESGAMPTEMCDGAEDFLVGETNYSGANRDPFNGTLGPVYWWKGEVVATATLDLLYNSGKGMTCAAAAEVDTMTACWDLDEDGGPYEDSVGSEDMAAENTPLRVAGLVERSDSGMSTNLVTASAQQFTQAASLLGTGEFTVVAWVNLTSTAAGENTVIDGNAPGGSRTDLYYFVGGSWTAYIGGQFVQYAVSPINTWRMVAFGWDSTLGKGWLSVDGSAKGDHLTAAVSSASWSSGIEIGDRSANYFDGSMDNVAIFPSSLSDADLTALYAAGAGLFYPEEE